MNIDYSLAPVATRLSQLLDRHVVFADDCVGPKVAAAIDETRQANAVVLLENLRFHRGGREERPGFFEATCCPR